MPVRHVIRHHQNGKPMNFRVSPATTYCLARILVVVAICTSTVSAQQPSKSQPARKKSRTTKPERYDTSVPKPTVAGVRYGNHERHILDFWKAESSTPTPLVFVIHGGGWQGGSKERIHRFADVGALLKAGISVTALNYRYVRQGVEAGVKPPVKAPLHDAARALQFVRSKAVKWNIDKQRIGAAGGSAGACSSLWLAFHDDLADQNSDDPVARESTRLWCAAVIGAQTTLDPKQMKEWTPNSKYGGHAFGLAGFPKFLAERGNILPWIAEYSPYALVTKDDPPVYLIYSAPPALGQDQRDPTHTSNFGVKLQEHCAAIGVDCQLVYPKAPVVKHANPTDYLIKTLKSASQ
jgi:acetyl esterase/lipase